MLFTLLFRSVQCYYLPRIAYYDEGMSLYLAPVLGSAYTCDYWTHCVIQVASGYKVVSSGYMWFQAVSVPQKQGGGIRCDRYVAHEGTQGHRTLRAITVPATVRKVSKTWILGMISGIQVPSQKWLV